ncbi:MAG TPA: iron ABC transporter permease [Thermoanaerobaculia bacterium]|nr:iron ABC transporter permease [Thermoanaerobaculia bacterium]
MSDRDRGRRRYGVLVLLLAVVLLASAAGSLLVGSAEIPLRRTLTLLASSQPSLERTILLKLRLPRILLALVVGAGLASAGTAYQSLFSNPLADPFVIGASSGAALGATAAILAGWGWNGGWGIGPLPLLAFGGALATVGLVYLIGAGGSRSSPVTLLLAGAAVSTVVGALVSLLMILHDQSLGVIFNWLLGGLSSATWHDVRYGAPLVGLGVLALRLLSRPLDALALGDDTVASLGLSALGLRLAIVVAATVATAAAVATAGIIGFVGLVAPHAARLLVGGENGRLLPASCLLGALLLLLADDAARTLAAPQEIPISILTALVGGPFFLLLLRRQSRAPGGLP